MPSVVYVTGSDAKETAVDIALAMKKSGYSPVVVNRDIALDQPKGVIAVHAQSVAEDHARLNHKPVIIRA